MSARLRWHRTLVVAGIDGHVGECCLRNLLDRAWAEPALPDDLLDAVDWAVREKVTTPAKVAIYGGSYGGYATLVGLTFTPDRFACGVDIVGPSNLNTLLASIPPYWKAFFEDLARRVGDPRTEDGRAVNTFHASVKDLDQLKQVIRSLSRIKGVYFVDRVSADVA